MDHIREVVDCARRNIAHKELEVDACVSGLFENVSGRYDLICFNPPYVDSDRDEHERLMTHRPRHIASDIAEKRFSGGPSGGWTIARFLDDVPRYLAPRGVLLLGVNHYHLRRSTMRGLIRASALSIQSNVGNPLTGACVYVLRHGQASRSVEPVRAKPSTGRQARDGAGPVQ